MDLKPILQSITGLLRVSKVKSAHVDLLTLQVAVHVPVCLEVGLVIVHNGTVLFLSRFTKYDVHGLNDVVLHAHGVSDGRIDAGHGLTSLVDTSLVLFLQFLDDPPLQFIDDLVELIVVFLHLGLLLLEHLQGLVDVLSKHLLLL